VVRDRRWSTPALARMAMRTSQIRSCTQASNPPEKSGELFSERGAYATQGHPISPLVVAQLPKKKKSPAPRPMMTMTRCGALKAREAIDDSPESDFAARTCDRISRTRPAVGR
jgi:hypothetical protein